MVWAHMSYTVAGTDDVESVIDAEYGGMWFLRDALDAEDVGVTILELEPGGKGKEHDHAHDAQEEVYVVVDGEITVHLDARREDLEAGEAIRLAPDRTRRLENTGDQRARLVLVGGPREERSDEQEV